MIIARTGPRQGASGEQASWPWCQGGKVAASTPGLAMTFSEWYTGNDERETWQAT